MTSKDLIRQWFQEGKRRSATHMLVVCDTFDYGDYPVYVAYNESLFEKAAHYDHKDMQRIMECYDLSMDMESQMAEVRAWHGWQP